MAVKKLLFAGMGSMALIFLAGCGGTVKADLTEPLVVPQPEKPAGERVLLETCTKNNANVFISKSTGPGLKAFNLYEQDDKMVGVWKTPRKIEGSNLSVQLYFSDSSGNVVSLVSLYNEGQVSDYTRLNSTDGISSVPVRSTTVVNGNSLTLTFPKNAIQTASPYKLTYVDIAQNTQMSGVCEK